MINATPLGGNPFTALAPVSPSAKGPFGSYLVSPTMASFVSITRYKVQSYKKYAKECALVLNKNLIGTITMNNAEKIHHMTRICY